MHANTKQRNAGRSSDLNKGDCLCIAATADRSLFIGQYIALQSQRIDQRIDRTVATAAESCALTAIAEFDGDPFVVVAIL